MKTMKKGFPVMMAAALLFPTGVLAEEAPKLTMEQVVEANMTENLLKNYDSFHITMNYSEAEIEVYKDSEIYYYSDSWGEYLKCGNMEFDNYNNGEYTKYIYVENEPQVYPQEENCLMTVDSTVKEEIQEIKKDGDNLILTTKLTAEDYAEISTAKESPFEEGDYGVLEYTLDSTTYAVLKSKETIMHKDGTEGEVLITEVQYNQEKPEKVRKMYDLANPTENIRTLTIITNPGTDQEKEYKESVAKGESIAIMFPDDTWKLYTDEQCTQEKGETVDKEADALYYAKSVAESTAA